MRYTAAAAISLILSTTQLALAGQSPESVVVVVNADSWASLTVANEYARLRHIPAGNFVALSGLSSFDGMGPDEFRAQILGPVLKAIDDRGLRAQVDCIAYSVDLPSVIWVQSDMNGKKFPQVITAAASANSVTYLHELFMQKDTAYLDLDINRYARRTLPMADGKPLSAVERAEYARGVTLYDAKKFAEAVAAIAPLLGEPRNDAGVYYNFACCQALAGDADGAFASLKRAVEIGWRNHGQMTSDPDLASLAERADLKELVASMKARKVEVQETRGFRGEYAWGSDGAPAAQGSRYLLSTMLGVTAGRGNSVREVLECLRRAEQADATEPKGTVYIERNGDVRSTTREWAFAPLVDALRKLGVTALIEDGVLPVGKRDVAGAVIGIADFNWADSKSTILPGAICEHLTSCGGMMGERDGQTPCTAFIRAGAAGSSGAVTEPYALQAKFPSPFIQWHYARGATLAEAFYQSLEGPYQLLVIGDPLCRPWAKASSKGGGGVTVEGAARGATMKGQIELKPRGAPGEDPAKEFEFFVDGVRVGRCAKGEVFALDTTKHGEGAHTLSVVATRSDAIESRDRVEYAVKFAHAARAGALSTGAVSTGAVSAGAVSTGAARAGAVTAKASAAKVAWGKPLSIEVACEGATGIDVMHLGRVVGHVNGAKGAAAVDSTAIGSEKAQLRAVAHFAASGAAAGGSSAVDAFSAPIEVEVELPAIKAARAGKDAGARGLTIATTASTGAAKGAKSAPAAAVIVTDTFDPAWIASRVQDGKPFEITGWFDAPAADLWQVQIATNTGATVEIDGVKLVHAKSSALGSGAAGSGAAGSGTAGSGTWHYAPANLAQGTHRLRITGKAPAKAADARMDLRIGCAGTQHPTEARFRCEAK